MIEFAIELLLYMRSSVFISGVQGQGACGEMGILSIVPFNQTDIHHC